MMAQVVIVTTNYKIFKSTWFSDIRMTEYSSQTVI